MRLRLIRSTHLEEEVFGPILHVIRYRSKDLDRIIDEINGTGYGLTLGVHSRIDRTQRHIAKNVLAGNCYINRNMIGAVVGVQPFGGESAFRNRTESWWSTLHVPLRNGTYPDREYRRGRWQCKSCSNWMTKRENDLYLQFFGLNETPFSITPDPAFVYLSAGAPRCACTPFIWSGAGWCGWFRPIDG